MAKYRIILSSRAEQMLLRHTEFLSRVSIPAAKAFYREFEDILRQIRNNPYQFPLEEDLNLPKGQYHKALFARRYKALFLVEETTVYLDAVVDCRMDNQKGF